MEKIKSSGINVSHLIKGKEFFSKDLEERIKLGEEILGKDISSMTQLDAVKDEYYAWDDFNSEYLKLAFNDPENDYRQSYDSVNSFSFGTSKRPIDKLVKFRNDVKNKVTNLKQLLGKASLLREQDKNGLKDAKWVVEVNDNAVFIVHGHNTEVKQTVARTLDQLDLKPIILHEQPNSGKTIIEKFEEHSNVGFAVILLTADDKGANKDVIDLKPRARQNVILEMGYFIGKLGRDRICPLYMSGVELPSDLYGLVYTEIDQAGFWKVSLARELKAAGYDIDMNKIV